jgi:hypothetical protein
MMTPKLKWLAAGAALAGIAATAALADTMHHMTVSLPYGGIETIEYSGNVAPTVAFSTPRLMQESEDGWTWAPFAEMQRVSAMMDAMAADMDRQMQVSLQRVQQLAPGMTIAELNGLPPGTESYSVTTISTGRGVCTREVRITSNGEGIKPRMISQSYGCGEGTGPAENAPQTIATNTIPPATPLQRQHI